MPNVLITDYCNRACPYCFASERIGNFGATEGLKKSYISLRKIEYILGFLNRSNHRFFSILGGEPTVHPQFADIVELAIHHDMIVRVFTNGLMERETQKFLFRNNVNLIVNVNSPADTPGAHQKRLEGLYSFLGPNINPGFTIYREDFDLEFLFNMIDRHDMRKEIRLGVAHPIINQANKFIHPYEYRTIGRRLARFAEEAGKRNIRLVLDCGFILCMFSKAEIGKLVYSNAVLRFVCSPTIDIDPELNVWFCFPLSSVERRRLEEFADLNEIITFYDKIKKSYAHTGMFSRCKRCAYLKRNQCAGGCISHKIAALHKKKALCL